MLIKSKGVGVELDRERYEMGDWAGKIEEAWYKGGFLKQKRRKRGKDGDGDGDGGRRKREMDGVARSVVDWVSEWIADEERYNRIEEGKGSGEW